MPTRQFLLLAAALLAALTASAQEGPRERAEAFSEVDGTVTIAGKRIEYQATAGRLPVKSRTGKAMANIFFVAYTKKGVVQPATRPLTFCFNGGPGSSAAWLHLGAFGPRRIRLTEDGKTLSPPTRLVENEWSLLDLTDLVFIDPVSTGYSRARTATEAKQFHGVEADVQSVGDFIRLYTTRYKRTASPKYLAGESYGTTRAAALASSLLDRPALPLAGALLISTGLDFQTLRFDEGNDLPYPLFLPTYTASAWYHKKLGKDLAADLATAVEESRRFADGEYTLALRRGARLKEADRRAVAKKLARLTGLGEDQVLRADLRIKPNSFRQELLRARRAILGRFDSRFVGKGQNDPSYTTVRGPFGAAISSYLPSELKYRSGLKYEIHTGSVQPWNFGAAATNRYLNVAPRLRRAMEKNRSFRVFVASGYYDLATPFAATEHTFAHLGPPALSDRVTLAYYEAGHMMYTHKPSLMKLKADLARFFRGNEAPPPVAE